MTVISPETLACTGASTPYGRYLRRFWHPVLCSDALARGGAREVEILGDLILLCRNGAGEAWAAGATCPHRGARLCLGKVEPDGVRCFYHGWKFARDGQCVDQPADGPDVVVRARIPAYPTYEALGLIFVYLGPDAPPAAMHLDRMDGIGFHKAGQLDDWPCDQFVMVENAVDWSHTAWTHERSGLAALLPADFTFSAKETEFGVRVFTTSPTETELTQSTEFLMPNMNFFNIPLKSGRGSIWNIVWRVPVRDGLCRSFIASFASGDEALLDEAREQLSAFEDVSPPTTEMGERLLAGEIGWDDVMDRPDLTRIEDYVTQVGQRGGSRYLYAPSDEPVRLLRSILLREIRASEAGSELKAWTHLQGA